MEIAVLVIGIIIYFIIGVVLHIIDHDSIMINILFAPALLVFYCIGFFGMFLGWLAKKIRLAVDSEYADKTRKESKRKELENDLRDSYSSISAVIKRETEEEEKSNSAKAVSNAIKPSEPKGNTEYSILDMALDDFFAFRDKFPDRVISIFIHQANIDSSFLNLRISFLLDGQLSLYNSKESKKLQESFSFYDADNHISTYEFIYCTGEIYKNNKTSDEFIKMYVKQYMAIRPGINFNTNKTGAHIKYW